MQKSAALVCTNNELPKKEIKKIIPYMITPNRTNSTKKVTALYTENYEMLMKSIKKTEINGRTPCIHGMVDLILLKCPHYICNLLIQCNPYRISNSLFI